MIITAVITDINYNTNTCTIRMPVFENAGRLNNSTATAHFAIPPGVYNGYQKNDPVYVDFLLDKVNEPIVIGKVYNVEKKVGQKVTVKGETPKLDELKYEDMQYPTSSAAFENLIVTGKTVLPAKNLWLRTEYIDARGRSDVDVNNGKNLKANQQATYRSTYVNINDLLSTVQATATAVQDYKRENHDINTLSYTEVDGGD